MSNSKAKEAGASSRGFHYYEAFRNCPRLFYHSNILGLRAVQESKGRVLGKAYHGMKEDFYRGFDQGIIDGNLGAYLEENEEVFFNPAEMPESRGILQRAFASWVQTFGEADLERFASVAVETEISVEVKGARITGRLDAIATERDGSLTVLDTKTSSTQTPDRIVMGTDLSDQLPLYKHLVEKTLGKSPRLFVDATAFRKGASGHAREEVFYSQDEIVDVLEGLYGTWCDIQDRLEKLEEEPELWRRLFPRYTQKCSLWGCPYSDFCRCGVAPDRVGIAIPGFEWVDPDVDEEGGDE